MYNEQTKKVKAFSDRKVKTEAHLENIFCRKVEESGGWALKFTPAGVTGLPDRVVFYRGFTWLVELKTERGVVQPRQKVCHARFAKLGFKVRIVRNQQDVDTFIEDMLNMEF